MADDKEYRILIDSTFKDEGTKQASSSIKNLKGDTESAAKGTKAVSQSLADVGKTSAAINTVSVRLAAIGAVMSGAIIKGAKDYVAAVGMGTATSRAWEASTLSLRESYQKIGGVLATAVLPILQQAANLAEKLAAFFEKHPDLAKAAIAVAGVGTVLGGGAIAAVQAAKTVTAIQTIGTALGLGGGAIAAGAAAKTLLPVAGQVAANATEAGVVTAGATATGTAAGGVSASTAAAGTTAGEAAGAAGAGGLGTAAALTGTIVGGVLVGLAGNDALSKTKVGQQMGTQSTDKVLTVAAYEMGQLVEALGGKKGLALSWAGNVGGATGAVPKTPTATGASQDPFASMSDQLITETSNFAKTSIRAEQDYSRQRLVSQRDYNIQQQYAQADYQLQVQRSTRDFYMQQEFAAEDYYRQAAIASRDFYISAQRSEEDYNLSRARAAEDHNFDLQQIGLSGDALQYYYSQRQYNLTQKRAAEDYELQKKRAAEDFTKSQGDAAAQFAISQARSAAEFAIQEGDAAQNFAIQQKRTADQFAIQLSDMDYNYQKEKTRRQEDFDEEIMPELIGELATREAMEQKYAAYLQAVYASIPTAPAAPGKASGGYVNQGLYQLHSGEFVMTAQSTQAAESAAKGYLTQDKIMSMLSGGGGSGMVYNDNRQFARGLTSDEINDIRQDTRKILIDALA